MNTSQVVHLSINPSQPDPGHRRLNRRRWRLPGDRRRGDRCSGARQPIAYPLRVSSSRTVSLVTLGCARNEVDSEELAARLAAGGWTLRGEGEDADVVLVNTCGFIQAAKQESIDELLAAADSGAKVAAVGCLAERYGTELAERAARGPGPQLRRLRRHRRAGSTTCWPAASGPRTWRRDRRTLLPVSPAEPPGCPRRRPSRPAVDLTDLPPGVAPASGPPVVRRRLVRRRHGAAQDRLRLRPPLLVLRDPVLPRLVRLPAPARAAGRGRLAGRPGRARAGPGQRELHLLRQGPGRPAAARDGAARAGEGRRASPGSGSATCSRPRSGPA